MKINFGCGDDVRPGDWVNVDIVGGEGVVKAEIYRFLTSLPDNSVEEILLQDILEHFPHGVSEVGDQLVYKPAGVTSLKVLEASFNKLEPGGALFVRVPDIMYIMEKSLHGEFSWDRMVWSLFGEQGNLYAEHRTGWTVDKLGEVSRDIGYTVSKIDRVSTNIEMTARKPKCASE